MVAALHTAMGATPVDQSSTSQRDGNLLSSKHSIFLSHSGAQKSFVEQLCLDIERHDRYPFFDKRRDSLPIGEDFPKLIFEAIDQCQVGVVVLSEEFFSRSKWPMLELAAMVKRRARDAKFVIMLVFLGVKHAQCRDKVNQERWVRIWQGWARVDKRIKLREWQEALRVFGYMNGISLNDGLGEVKCREEIVEAVCKRVRPYTRWDDSHVQGRSRLSLLIRAKVDKAKVSKSYGARVLGIYGMGGMGKTTLCKVLCNEYYEEFEGRVCHIEFGVGGMLQMVQEVLKRLTDTNQELIGGFSIGECTHRLKQDLKKVLLAIDNVSDSQEIVDNAKELLRLGFMEGSIIIVMARSLAQLRNLNLDDCIEMLEMEEEDARSLFLHHAAPGLYLNGMGEINEQVMKRCIQRCYFRKGNGMKYHYHPLALKVLGGQLGNIPDEWMAKLDMYEEDPFNQYHEKEKDHPIHSILGRSFELLEYEDQLLFMDAAIFFPTSSFGTANMFEWLSMVHGRSRGEIMQRLEGLKSKSLVEDLGDGIERIAFHDLWIEFARVKAKGRESDQRPWINEKVYGLNDPRKNEESVLCGGGWKKLQRISMVGNEFRLCIVKELNLSRCSNLRVLNLVGVTIESQVLDLRSVTQMKSLQVFSVWDKFEVYFIGLGCLRNLAYLDLCRICTDWALLQEEIAGLTNLQVLHVFDLCHKTQSGRLTSQQEESTAQKWGGEGRCMRQSTGEAAGGILKRESGESGSLAWAEQHTLAKETWNPTRQDSPQVEEQACAESPSAGSVRALQPVSTSLDLSRLNLLRDMRFAFCEGVDMISGLNSRMTRLKRLRLCQCSSLRSCDGVGDLVALEELDLHICSKLKELPNLRRLKNLVILRISWCESIEAVLGLGDLVSLQVFEAIGCDKLAELPDMRKLVNLKTLDVPWCPLVEAIPGLSYLIGLEKLFANFAGLRGCRDLQKLKKLELIVIGGWGAGGIPCLSDLHSLKSLVIERAEGVDEWTGVSNSTGLQELRIEHCGFKGVPCLRNLTPLKSIYLRRCDKLERLPDMHRLSRLESLKISDCESLREWDSGSGLMQFGADVRIAGALLRLRTLSLEHVALTELPDLSRFPQLRELTVSRCGKLTSLISSAPLTALENLSLEYVALTELPDLSRFPQLRELTVSRCEKLTTLISSAPLTALENLFLQKCGVVRALRAELDLSHLVSPRSFNLWRSGTQQLMAHAIGKLQAMCPGPGLGMQLGHLQHMDLEGDE